KPQVDKVRLRDILKELDLLVDNLYKSQDKIGQKLRNNNFLNNIRQHMANPGGAFAFSTPPFFLWLQKPIHDLHQNLSEWYQDFEQINLAVKLLLQLTRGSSMPQKLIAAQGFYQQALDPKLAYHLVRVTIAQKEQLYPEISVGKHRLIVRFLQLNLY